MSFHPCFVIAFFLFPIHFFSSALKRKHFIFFPFSKGKTPPCFACQQCGHRFCVGDQFYLHDNQVTNNLNICQTEQPAFSGALWSGLRGADGLRLPLLTPTTSCSTHTKLPGKLPSPTSKSKLEWSSSCSTEARQFEIFYSIPLFLIISILLSSNAPPAHTDYVTILKKYTT